MKNVLVISIGFIIGWLSYSFFIKTESDKSHYIYADYQTREVFDEIRSPKPIEPILIVTNKDTMFKYQVINHEAETITVLENIEKIEPELQFTIENGKCKDTLYIYKSYLQSLSEFCSKRTK